MILLRILAPVQHSKRAPGHGHLVGLANDRKTWAYSTNSLGHCGLSAASTHNLAFTNRHYALLTATHTTKLPNNSNENTHYWMPMPTGNGGNSQFYGQ